MKLFGDAYLLSMPLNLDAALFAMPFYGFANLLRKHIDCVRNFRTVLRRIILPCLCVLLFALLWHLALSYGDCSMGSSIYNCSIFIFVIRAFVGISLVLLLSIQLAIASNKTQLLASCLGAIKWCGRNSLDIMCLHIPVKGVAIILITKLFKPSIDVSSSYSYSMLAFVITMVVVCGMTGILLKIKSCILEDIACHKSSSLTQ